jgi:hypothetical protein
LLDALAQDEANPRFDLIAFNHRCIRVFKRIQGLVLEKAPRDYSDCKGAFGINDILPKLLLEVSGRPTVDTPQMPGAVAILLEFIETESSMEYNKMLERAPSKTQVGKDGLETGVAFGDHVKYHNQECGGYVSNGCQVCMKVNRYGKRKMAKLFIMGL